MCGVVGFRLRDPWPSELVHEICESRGCTWDGGRRGTGSVQKNSQVARGGGASYTAWCCISVAALEVSLDVLLSKGWRTYVLTYTRCRSVKMNSRTAMTALLALMLLVALMIPADALSEEEEIARAKSVPVPLRPVFHSGRREREEGRREGDGRREGMREGECE